MSEQYSEINTDTLERVTEIFKALGDYNRIRIMELLSVSGSKCWSHFTSIEFISIKCLAPIKIT